MKLIKDDLFSLVIIVLLLTLFIERCNDKPVVPEPPKVVRDTVWVKHDSVVYSKPQVINTIRISSKDSLIYVPDTNYAKLVLQYQEVVNQLLSKNVLSDSIRIDTNGYVKITDTIQKNLIVGRSSKVNIKYPVIKETITIYPKPVNQVYIGGGIDGSQIALINQVRAGILLKNKKDQIYGVSAGINTSGQVVYGLSSYWKIKIK